VDGHATKVVTNKQMRDGRKIGKSREKNCYICRKYLTATGRTRYCTTTWRCVDCKMPICRKDRKGDEGREQTCMEEHRKSEEAHLGCFQGKFFDETTFPKDKQVNLNRRRGRSRNTT